MALKKDMYRKAQGTFSSNKGTLYNRRGIVSQKLSKAYYESDSDSEHEGGFIDLSSIINITKVIGKIVNDNKDTIQSVACTVGKVIELMQNKRKKTFYT